MFESPKGVNRCLIVAPSWVGDMVVTQSVLMVLKQNHPGLVIDVLVTPWVAPLVSRMPQITDSIEVKLFHGRLQLGKRMSIARDLRDKGYQQAIVIPNSFKSALIPWLAHIPVRTGYLGEKRYGLLNDWRRPHVADTPIATVERYAALALSADASLSRIAQLPLPCLQVSTVNQQRIIKELHVNTTAKCVVLCPGAEFGAARCWPARYYAQVGQHFLRQGWQVWLMGSSRDRPICEEIQQSIDHKDVRQLAGFTSLEDAIDLLALADLVISNDSGLMHVARGPGSESSGFVWFHGRTHGSTSEPAFHHNETRHIMPTLLAKIVSFAPP